MIIRCQCGNDVPISTAGDKPVLRKLDWYDAETQEVRCPKCKNNILPIIADGPVDANGVLPLRMDIRRPIELTRIHPH